MITAVAVVQIISRRGLPSMYSALRPGRVRYLTMNTTIVMVTRAQVIMVSQKMARKMRSMVDPKVEMLCGNHRCSIMLSLNLCRSGLTLARCGTDAQSGHASSQTGDV